MILLILPLLLLAPGYLTLAAWRGAERLDFWERLFLSIFCSILLTSWAGITLAEVGVFSIPVLASIVAIYCLAVALVARRRLQAGWLGRPKVDVSLVLIGVMVLAGWAFSRPAEVVAGTFDPGIYLSTSATISHYGSIAYTDPFLSQMGDDLRPFLLEQRGEVGVGAVRLPAFWMPEAGENKVIPAFFHLYPVWLAITYGMAGLQAALFVSPFFAVMGVWALFLLGRRLAGPGVGLLAAALLAVNPAQVWFARYPISEVTVQMLILGGLTLWVLMEENRSRLLALLAGAALGLAHLAKVDQIFVPAAVGLSIFLIWVFNRRGPGDGEVAPAGGGRPEGGARPAGGDVPVARLYRFLVIPYAFLLLHSMAHIYLFSFAYTWINVGPFLPALRSAPILVILAGGLMALVAGALFKDSACAAGAWLGNHRSHVSAALGAVVGAAALYGYFLWPLNPEPGSSVFLSSDGVTPVYLKMFREEGLVRLGWFLSPLGLVLGLAGFIQLAASIAHRRVWPLLILFTCQTTFYLLTAGLAYPVQFWATRRYVPLVIPIFLLLASLSVFSVGKWLQRRRDVPPARLYQGVPVQGPAAEKGDVWPARLCRANDQRSDMPGAGDVPVARLYKMGLAWVIPSLLAIALLATSVQTSWRMLWQTEYQGALEGLGRWSSQMEDPALVFFKPRMEGNIFSSPLQNFFGKTAFVLQQEIQEPFYTQGIGKWLAEDKKLYLVLSDHYPKYLSGKVGYKLIDDKGLGYQSMEQTSDRLPEKVLPVFFPLRLYRMEPAAGYPYRADMGPLLIDESLSLLLGRPATPGLRLTFRAWAAERSPVPVSVLLNGDRIQGVDVGPDARVYDIAVPARATPDTGQAEITLRPAPTSISGENAIVLEWVEVAEAAGR